MAEDIVVFPVGASEWPEMESLFESVGSPKYCWCMLWRERFRASGQEGNALRKSAMRDRVVRGEPVGLLARCGNELIAWCSVAPRATFLPLGGPDDFEDNPDAVWSLTCFFVKRKHRGEGVTNRLLGAAIERAREQGAMILEAYPVAVDSPTYRYMGLVPQFEKFGFVRVGSAGKRRIVHRLRLVG